ncbi:MAG: DEAD/DEAH box helicase [Endozoicomonadaceae bacterium]|nr:DEAD/DEAH box helicase [Endozoicomonadaceae bacterium]
MSNNIPQFRDLGLSEPILQSLEELGYETPSPIQAESIPLLLDHCDLLGQAQTGTGKTAAFALPLLNNLDLSSKETQLLVLAPTRELAIQVSEAFQSYARYLKGFHILPIYGGQAMSLQLRQLQRGVQVVVGTPGRVMDHIRRGTLNLKTLAALVLDEADEMLKMGFIDDIEWILEHTPDKRQIALFSATMPEIIRKVAHRHLNNPHEVRIKAKTATVDTTEQFYWLVNGLQKLDALTRILETEESDGLIIFVRTKTSTVELAEKLEARGYISAPLHGDMTQPLRERTVEKLRDGQLDIVVATDVAARGLDVERISHVINYDIPHDTEAYVHRIGRTGRAGRKGKAILFVTNRERRMLRSIERATRQAIKPLTLPSRELVSERRVSKMMEQVNETLINEPLDFFKHIVTDKRHHQTEVDTIDLAAALLFLAQKDRPLQLKEDPVHIHESRQRGERRERGERSGHEPRLKRYSDTNMQRYRLDVGRAHGVMPGNIVGAIANESKSQINNQSIGHIKLFDTYSTVDLPADIHTDTIQHLQKVRVCGRPLKMEQIAGGEHRAGQAGNGNRRR